MGSLAGYRHGGHIEGLRVGGAMYRIAEQVPERIHIHVRRVQLRFTEIGAGARIVVQNKCARWWVSLLMFVNFLSAGTVMIPPAAWAYIDRFWFSLVDDSC